MEITQAEAAVELIAVEHPAQVEAAVQQPVLAGLLRRVMQRQILAVVLVVAVVPPVVEMLGVMVVLAL